MDNKTKVIIVAVLLIVAFASGRYLSPTKVVTETKTVEVVKTVEVKNEDKVEIKKPDGTVIIRTITKTDTSSQSTKDAQSSSTTERTASGVSIQALAGLDVRNPANGYVFGASISKPILGPIELGVWGLTNGTGGLSVGLRF